MKETTERQEYWITGYKETKTGFVPIISTRLNYKDILGNIKARIVGHSRDRYKIQPGLYCAGNPNDTSPVLVTSNYKLTFNTFRKELNGIDCWILVLDTKGVNVWCAAAKGTFGTQEIIERVNAARLKEIVNHNLLILPQLSAPGVIPDVVINNSGFRVKYGPVRASDIPAFLKNNLKKDEKMRTVEFNLKDRLVLIPIEFVLALAIMIGVFILVFIADWILDGSINISTIFENYFPFAGAVITGCVLVPVLLPIIPTRSFTVKGILAGIILAVIVQFILNPSPGYSIINFLIIITTSAIFALFYVGSTTFTSVSGVRYEVKYAFPILIPILIISGITGFGMKLYYSSQFSTFFQNMLR